MNEREPPSARARQLRAAAVITAVWFFGVASAHACLELLPSYGWVGPSFVVKLRDPENRPLQGIRVRVRERNSSRGVVPKEIASAITDETGTATFSGLRWGWNWLEVDHPAGETSGGTLVVDSLPGHEVRDTAWITWPRAAVIKASTLTGALQTESGALADAQVELLHG